MKSKRKGIENNFNPAVEKACPPLPNLGLFRISLRDRYYSILKSMITYGVTESKEVSREDQRTRKDSEC